jgi:hypothetical protein
MALLYTATHGVPWRVGVPVRVRLHGAVARVSRLCLSPRLCVRVSCVSRRAWPGGAMSPARPPVRGDDDVQHTTTNRNTQQRTTVRTAVWIDSWSDTVHCHWTVWFLGLVPVCSLACGLRCAWPCSCTACLGMHLRAELVSEPLSEEMCGRVSSSVPVSHGWPGSRPTHDSAPSDSLSHVIGVGTALV